MGFHINHIHRVMTMNKQLHHGVLQKRGLNVKTAKRKILYSSFRPLYFLRNTKHLYLVRS